VVLDKKGTSRKAHAMREEGKERAMCDKEEAGRGPVPELGIASPRRAFVPKSP